jgi:hypothetical protein
MVDQPELANLSHCVLGWNSPSAEDEQRKLFGGDQDGAMSFAIKIRIAYALGVFGEKTRSVLDIMRHERNFFAHGREHVTFDDPDVSSLCDQLKWIDDYPWGGLVGPKPANARGRYVQTVMFLFPYFASAVGTPIKYSAQPNPFSEMFA